MFLNFTKLVLSLAMDKKAKTVLTVIKNVYDEWVTQYEKQLKSKKTKLILIAYRQGYILNKFNEPQEFIGTLTQKYNNIQNISI